MSKGLGMRCVRGLGAVLAGALLLGAPGGLRAEVSTDLSGSIVVFPKVVWSGGRDTVIQLSNTSTTAVHVRCFYVNASPLNPSLPPGPTNPPRWQVTDFELWLTKQQPTHWVASQGRFVNPTDGFAQDGSGLDPGAIPPVPPGFVGELKCVQVDTSGVPFGGNSLKGEAVIRGNNGDVSKYNAVTILANPDLASGEPANELLLDNTPSSNDGEYNSCPAVLLVDHFVDGAQNPVVANLNAGQCPTETDCPIHTALTLVPCSEDFENVIPSQVTVQFEITNEFEQAFSASTTVDCWLNLDLADVGTSSGTCSADPAVSCQSDAECGFGSSKGFCVKQGVFSPAVLGTATAYTRVVPVGLDGGVVGVAEELHLNNSGNGAWAAWNLQQEGTRFDATIDVDGGPVVDRIVLPQS